jgi:hydrogenase maturation factor HypE
VCVCVALPQQEKILAAVRALGQPATVDEVHARTDVTKGGVWVALVFGVRDQPTA